MELKATEKGIFSNSELVYSIDDLKKFSYRILFSTTDHLYFQTPEIPDDIYLNIDGDEFEQLDQTNYVYLSNGQTKLFIPLNVWEKYYLEISLTN